MIIGVVGSRDLKVEELEKYIPNRCKKIVSGGAKGIDKCAAEYARKQGIELLEILPEYQKYGKAAPLLRNKIIADKSDIVIAFWNGSSKGTRMVIDYCKKINKACTVVKMLDDDVNINVDDISLDDLTSVDKRLFVLRELTKMYSKKNFEIVENAPDVFYSIHNKLKSFFDERDGRVETEISIEYLSASINIVLPILFLSKEDMYFINGIQNQISKLIVVSHHDNVRINISVPYFVDRESPHIKAWEKLRDECEKNNINPMEEFEK